MAEGEDISKTAPRGGAPVLGVIFAVAYAAAGIAFYVYSGRAEEFISPRLGFLLAALTSVPLGVYMLVALIFRLSWPRAGSRGLIVAGIVVSYLFIVLGYRLDGALTAESMARGDILIRHIEDYKSATGAYPMILDEMGGRSLPVPALDGSAFIYSPTADGGFVLAFPSVAFLICSRTSAAPDWACDD